MNNSQQLTNFNSSFIGSNPSQLTDINGVIYFTADDGKKGRELWKLDERGNPEPVGDINGGFGSSNPDNLIALNGTLYFTADDGREGRELWKINETGVPEQVDDINNGANSSNPSNLTVSNNTLYFIADDERLGRELFKLDDLGNPRIVKDITGSSQSSNPANLTILNDSLYFTLTDRNGGVQIWKETKTGSTQKVDDFPNDFSNLSNFTVINNTLFFTVNDRNNKVILSKINNKGNVQPVNVIYSSDHNLSNLTATNNALYFTTKDSNNRPYFWKTNSNGDVENIGNYRNLEDLSDISNLVVVNDTLYFNAIHRYNGLQLWQIDNNGYSKQVNGTVGTYSNLSGFTVVNDTLYFTSDNSRLLWQVDNKGKASQIIDSNASDISNLTIANNTLYFSATDRDNNSKLFKINERGDVDIVRDMNEMSNPSNLEVVNDTLYFTARDKNSGNELWKIENNEFDNREIAVRLSDINRQTRQAPSDFINVNGTLYFTAEDRNSGRRLWRIDSKGNPQSISSPPNIEDFTVVNDTLYFTYEAGSEGRQLLKITNGDSPIAKPVGNSSILWNPENLTIFNDTLYFTATDPTGEKGLIRLDDEGNVEPVRFFGSSSNYSESNPQNLTVANNSLYLTAGARLWKINERGDAESIRDVNYNYPPLNPENLISVNNTIYFNAETERYGKNLWTINERGYSESIGDAQNFDKSSKFENFTIYQDKLLFTVSHNQGTEFWTVTDRFGKLRPEPIRNTPSFQSINNLTVFKDTIYFTADDGKSGNELWKFDERGNIKLLGNSSTSSNPENLTVVNDILYFTDITSSGRKLWWVNSEGDIRQVKSINSRLTNLSNITVLNDELYLTGIDSNSRELWKVSGDNAKRVAEINRDSGFSDDFNLSYIDGKLYFVSDFNSSSPQIQVIENQAPKIQLSRTNLRYAESWGFVEYSRPANIASNAKIIDPDSDNFNNGKLIVRITDGGDADDRLGIGGRRYIKLDGRIVKYRDTEIGILTPSYGVEDMVIDFNANATRSAVEELLESITYSNFSRNPSRTTRTVEFLLDDGDGNTSEAVSTTINISGRNDFPLVGYNQFLYDSSTGLKPTKPDAAPNGSWLDYKSISYSQTNLNIVDNGIQLTSDNQAYAGLSNYGFSNIGFDTSPVNRYFPQLIRGEGYILKFNAQILSEDHTSYGNNDKNGDGKADRAGFSVTLLSDDRKGIELGFWENRIWVQQDEFTNTTSQPVNGTNPYSTLFTQVEGVNFDTTKSVDYDLAILGEFYTLYADNKSILTGRLRDYSDYKPTTQPERNFPNPYRTSNFIFLGDNNAYAGADVKLGDISLITHPRNTNLYPLESITYKENEPAIIIAPEIILTELDSPNFSRGSLDVRIISATPDEILDIANTQQITVSGEEVLFDGNAIGTISSIRSNLLKIRFNPQATPKAVETLMRNITYANSSENPLIGSRRIEFRVDDGSINNGESKPATREILIQSVNDAPIVANPIALVTTNEETEFSYTIPENTFQDIDGDTLTLNATLEDGSPLPTWLSFDTQTATFSGTPQDENVGFIKIKVTATDKAQESTQTSFTLKVTNVNKVPTINPNQTFTIEENSRIFSSVGKVQATDLDNDFLLDWKITDGNLDVDNDGREAFSINYITGEIKVNDSDDLDFETNPSFNLKVTASDRIDTSIPTTVTVNLNDITGQQIIGTSGNDRRLYGGLESDTIDGKERNDYLYGRGGNDTLLGGTGNDNLYGGSGDDSIDGGTGFDIIRESADVNFTLTENQLTGQGTDTFTNIERAILSGGNSDNIIDASAYSKNTYLYGRGGNDTLIGGTRNDYFYGGRGDDSIDGGRGYDIIRETKDVDFILTDNQLIGNGTDRITSVERVILTGGNSNNKIDGSNFSGSVYIYARSGNDTLLGGAGNDYFRGDNGDDLINSGAGNDRVYGGSGKDIFVLSQVSGKDIIYDFENGVDSLGLSDGLTFNDLDIQANGNNTNIMFGNQILATLSRVNSSLIEQSDFTTV